jgi:fibronectin-binding autotransporter adhesin
MKPRLIPSFLAPLAAAGWIPTIALSQTTIQWNTTPVSSVNTAWSTAANWTGGNIPDNNGERGNISRDFTGNAPIIALNGALTINGFTYDDTGTGTDLNLTINQGTTTSGSGLTLAATSGAVAPVINIAGATATVNADLLGTAAWSKTGGQVLVLAGNNTFNGALTISDGTLRAGSANALGNGTSIVVVNNETLTAGNTNQLQLSGGFAYGAGKTLTLRNTATGTSTAFARAALDNSSGNNSWDGTILIEGGTNQTISSAAGTLTINGNVNTGASASTSIFIRGNSTGVLNGKLNLGTATLYKTDTGSWTINSTGSVHGKTQVSNGTVTLNNNNALAAGTELQFGESSVNTGTLVVNSGFTQLIGNVSVPVGSTTAGGHRLVGPGSVDVGSTQRTFTINDATAPVDLLVTTPVLGSGGFIKDGAGVLSLDGASVTGPVTLSAGTLMVGGSTTASTLTLGGLQVPAGATANLALNVGSGGDSLTVTGSNGLSASGLLTLNVTQFGGALAPGNHPLISYSGTLGGVGISSFALAALPARMVANLVDTGSAVALQVVSNDSVTWTGSAGATWDIQATENWKLSGAGTSASYLEGDVVVFGDSGSGPDVSIAAGVTPSWLWFTNTASGPAWRIGGVGINGTGGITKSGDGVATLATPTAVSGPVSIQQGTFEIDHDTGALSAAVSVDVAAGSTLRLTRDGGADFTFSRPITGSGTLSINPHTAGGDTASRGVALTGSSSSFNGTIVLESPVSGTSRITTPSQAAIGTASIVVERGGQFYGNTTYANPIRITGDGFIDSLGPIGALRMDGGVWNGTVTVTGTPGDSAGTLHDARIGGNATTAVINGGISGGDILFCAYGTTTQAFVLSGTNSYGDTIIGGEDNTSTGGLALVVVGDNSGSLPTATSGTLGSGTVYLVPSNNGTTKPSGLRIRRADGFSLNQDVVALSSASARLGGARFEADSTGSGVSLNGRKVDLSDGVNGGQFRVAAATNGAIANLDNNSLVEVGTFYLGDASGMSGTVNQSAGSSVQVINQVRVGHWPNETSVWNMTGGSLAVTTSAPGTGPSGTGEQNGGIYVGVDGTGILNQSGGTISTYWVVLDNRSDTAVGIDQYNLSGGVLELKAATGIIRRNVSAELNFTGGMIRNMANGALAMIDTPVNLANSPVLDTNGAANGFVLPQTIAGTGTLTVQGGGVAAFNGVNTFTGTVLVPDGTTLSGTGTLPGTVTATKVSPGASAANGATGTLTLGTDGVTTATLAGTVTFDLNAADPFVGNDLVDIKGNVDFSQTKILPRFYGGDVLPGTYTLFQYTGTATGTPSFDPAFDAASFRQSFTIDVSTPGVVKLVVAGGAGTLTWVGDGTGNQWDLASSPNWSGASKFYQLDTVTINDTGSNSPDIVLIGSLSPAKLTVNNSTRDFTLVGTGSISGGASLVKEGTGRLTLATDNSYIGITDIYGGVVEVGNGGNSGTLGLGKAVFDPGTELHINRADAFAFGNTLEGGGTLVQKGAGTLLLGGNNTAYNGEIRVSSGVLKPTVATAFGAASGIRIGSGGQVSLNGINFGNTRSYSYSIAGAGPDARGALINEIGAPASNSSVVSLTLTADAAVGSYGGTLPLGNRFDIGYNGTTFGTIDGGGFTLTKIGDGMVNMRTAASNIRYVVATGTLRAENNDLAFGDLGVTVMPGARLDSFGDRIFAVPVTLAGSAVLSSSSGTATWNSVIAESVADTMLTLEGGANLVLNAANDYKGGTLVKGAQVTAGHEAAFGPGKVTVESTNNNGRVVVGNGVTVANALTLATSGGTAGRGLLEGPAGGVGTWSGPIEVTGGPSGGGHFSGSGAGAVLRITGPITSAVGVSHREHTLELSGGGNYPSLVSTNTLRIGANDGIATGCVVTLGGSAACTFDLNGFNQTLAGLLKGGSAGTTTNNAATLSTLALDIASGTTNTYAGSFTGNLALVKKGGGVLVLSVANSHGGGTTVEAGELNLTGGGGLNGTIRGSVSMKPATTLRLSTADATGYGATDNLSVIDLDGATLDVNSTANQTLGNATIRMTGAAITGIAGSNLDFYQGASALVSKASDATSTVTGVTLSPLRQGDTTFTVENGAATVDLRIDSVVRSAPSGDVAGATLIKAGDGTLELTNANTYAGNTRVSAGKVLVSNTTGSATGSGSLSVLAGAVLAGSGSVGGATTISGALQPGESGTESLEFGSTLTLAAGSTTGLDITGATTHDKLVVTGALDASGTIQVKLNGHVPAKGESFDLVDAASITGTPVFNFDAAPLPSGLKWDTSAFATTGTISVKEDADPYAAWAQANGLTVGVNDGAEQDPDGDGVANLMEFALGGAPLVASNTILPKSTPSGNGLVFTFKRNDAAEQVLTFTVQHGASLANWQDIAVGQASDGPVVVVENDADADEVTVTIPATGASAFARLRVAPKSTP